MRPAAVHENACISPFAVVLEPTICPLSFMETVSLESPQRPEINHPASRRPRERVAFTIRRRTRPDYLTMVVHRMGLAVDAPERTKGDHAPRRCPQERMHRRTAVNQAVADDVAAIIYSRRSAERAPERAEIDHAVGLCPRERAKFALPDVALHQTTWPVSLMETTSL
jgi:hypothetical protein